MARILACSCGGHLRPATLRKVDLVPLFGLRGTALSRLLPRLPTADRKELASLLADIAAIFTAPRSTQPPKRTRPYVISAAHLMAA